MDIGRVVKSNSHVDYVCQVFGPAERAQTPRPDEYAFGRWVRIALQPGEPADLIGIIYNTILLNPEFGSLGPRLSPRPELEVFTPDYLNEQVTLVGILVVGSLPHAAGEPAFQGIPPLAARVDAEVSTLSAGDMCRFHQGPDGPLMAYLPHLLSQQNPLIQHLVLDVLDQVLELFPEHESELAVLRDNMAWRMQIEQAR